MCKNSIKITEKDGFVWRIVTDVAKEILSTGLFPIYELHDDDSESLISDIEHLTKCLENGSDIGIEVGFTNYKIIEELKQRIKSHDFTYEHSDDYQRYVIGRENLSKIVELSKFVDRDDYIKWWNRSAPKNYEFIK